MLPRTSAPTDPRGESVRVVTCRQCQGIEQLFSPKLARRELRRFRRRGPIASTQRLLDALTAAGVSDASLLDIGGGIGALHHVLLDAGARDAVHVDVSPAYLAAARDECDRRGHGGRVRLVQGDFVELATELPDADIVTLDRVICCYPDMERLVARSAAKARRLYGAVYPRDAWWMRGFAALMNVVMRLRRSAFRLYLHPPPAIGAVLRREGLERRSLRRTIAWEVAVYERPRTG